MALLEQTDARYLRSPRLVARGDGGADLYVVAWEGARERLLRHRVDATGDVLGEPEVCADEERIVALTPSSPPRPTDDDGAEHRACDGDAVVEIRHEGPVSEVWLSRGANRVLVFRAHGIAATPAVAATSDGIWVAFHHDVREDDRRADIAKWIALRFVDTDGRVLEPEAPMLELDRELAEVEQSFEFPALVAGEDGAVALFGRGSHNYWRQDLSREGFSPRQGISDGEWGSRGRRVAATRLADGAVLVARRERRGIEVTRLAPVTGGRAALRPAEVDWAASVAPRVEAVDRDRDPARRRGLGTYFGDIQQHSAHSDGIGSADEPYLRARYRYGDDFVALTDHESFIGKRTGPGEWEYLQAVADRHDAPSRFATLLAYEWTGRRYPGPGHKCVYLPRRGMPLVSRDELPEGADLVARIREMGGIASPHHIGWTGCDEPGHDPVGQPVWEICSCHGCYEHADHPLGQRGDLTDQLVDVMLKKGHRFGFTASSDSHGLLWHHGESRKRDPFRTGLTAVQLPELTRDGILDALRARRCYATSGVKILLDLEVGGRPMGSELADAGPAPARAEAVGVSALARLELVGPEGVLARVEAGGDHAVLEAEARGPWVYARAVQADGEMAWSSPVFFA